eukprot:3308445-Pleurochrysis_carterae.AAC.1
MPCARALALSPADVSSAEASFWLARSPFCVSIGTLSPCVALADCAAAAMSRSEPARASLLAPLASADDRRRERLSGALS